MLEALQRHYGPLRNASVVWNGRTAARFGTGVKEPFVFSAGRLWDRAKNVEAIVEVAPDLRWPVVVAGFDHLSDRTGSHTGNGSRDQAAPGRRSRAAVRVGRLSETEIAAWLGRASIFAHPARYEPFGLLPLEAALSGCALVLGDIPSLREVWDDAALFVDPEDRAAIANAINRLAGSETMLHQFAGRARERARQYTPGRIAAGYLNLYECIAGRRRGVAERLRCAS
jgi:glycosyltransferase involved in cell wall biosynthesis